MGYKDLSDYVNIADGIEPTVDKESFNRDFGTNINSPVEGGLSDFNLAASKMDFRQPLNEGNVTSVPKSANPMNDDELMKRFAFAKINKPESDEDVDDAFDEFLKKLGTGEWKKEFDDEDQFTSSNEIPEDVLRIMDSPEMQQKDGESVSDWVRRVGAINEKRQHEQWMHEQKPLEEDFEEDFKISEEIRKNKIPQKVIDDMAAVLTKIKTSGWVERYKNNPELPANYLETMINTFSNTVLSDSINRDYVRELLVRDLKASHGDIEQLFEIYLNK